MPEIPSIGHGSVGPINRTTGPAHSHVEPKGQELNGYAAAGDRVELCNHAMLLDRLRQLPAVRSGLIDTVRHSITDGTYETPQRLDGAVERLFEDLIE